MSPDQSELFRRYVELGDARSLKKLHAGLQSDDHFAAVTFRQLSRWSNKYKWSELVGVADKHIDEQVQAAVAPLIASMVQKQIGGLHTIQQRFLDRLAIDPNDPLLDDRQKARAIDPDFRDFEMAVKLERLILGDPTERKEIVTETRIVTEYSKAELLTLARDIAAKRFGVATIPPRADDIEGAVKALPAPE
jgi:hypothetical protein